MLKHLVGATFAVAASVAPLAVADSITVLNPSFESPAVSPGVFSVGVITDWSVSAGNLPGGVFHPVGLTYNDLSDIDGNQVAYSNGGIISQTLTETLQAGMTYTLMVEVGNRADTNFSGYLIELLAGTTVIASDNNGVAPASGEFLTSTIEYTAMAGDADLGEALSIQLRAFGIQTNFDNVRLNGVDVDGGTTVIPTPTASLLSLMGLTVFAARRRKA